MGMYDFLGEKNRISAFEHFVENLKKQNKETIVVNGNEYSYTTKRGLVKKYIAFNTFEAYRKSEFYPNNKMERIQGFFFVEI